VRYTGAARRAELRFSSHAFLVCAVVALVLALVGWVRLHDATVTGFHVCVAVWCARQSRSDAALAAQITGD
jgi:hypothetical protein